MVDNIIEHIRKQAVSDIFQTGSVSANWATWRAEILRHLSNPTTTQSVLNLGDHLSNIFTTTGQGGRAQNSLSGGGAAWESLILWYVNLCCAGSRVVAIKKMAHAPQPIKDAITVTYNNFSCSTESDIIIIVFPDFPKYTSAANKNTFFNNNGRYQLSLLNNEVITDFLHFKIGIIQCKTNWNDNAQIPMLWDMVYSAGGFGGRQINVGTNGFSIQDLPTNSFSYSFVTVPSNNLNQYAPNRVAVRRVTGLTGGNYWERTTRQGVAKSVKEIFNNYNSGFLVGGIRTNITDAIGYLGNRQMLDYFNLY